MLHKHRLYKHQQIPQRYKIDGLLGKKAAKRVVYLDVEVDASIIEDGHTAPQSASDGVHGFTNREGEDHLIVPIGLVEIFENEKQLQSKDIDNDMFRNTKRFSKGSPLDRDYELNVNRQYLPSNTKKDNFDTTEDFYDGMEFLNNHRNKKRYQEYHKAAFRN